MYKRIIAGKGVIGKLLNNSPLQKHGPLNSIAFIMGVPIIKSEYLDDNDWIIVDKNGHVVGGYIDKTVKARLKEKLILFDFSLKVDEVE